MHMTLSSEIAALTGDEDAATLRAIDARVAVLLEWLPVNFGEEHQGDDHPIVREANEYKPGVVTLHFLAFPKNRRLHLRPAPFTTSLDATLAEITRRGWTMCADNDGDDYKCMFGVNAISMRYLILREDDNLPLAALEALVRAVEGQG